MKSEERHQLQQNELADWLTRFAARAKPLIPHFAAAIVLAFVALWVWGYIADSRKAKRGEAWKDFFGAQNPDQLQVVIERYPNSEIVPFAQLRMAQFYFRDGKSRYFQDRSEALSKLEKAEKTFSEVAAKAPAGSMLKSQGLLGIAVARETAGMITEAIESYKRVVSECRDTAEATFAEAQIKNLETAEARDFYAKVKMYEPKSPSTDLPPKASGADIPFALPDAMKPKGDDSKVEIPPPPIDLKTEKVDSPKTEKETAKKADDQKASGSKTSPEPSKLESNKTPKISEKSEAAPAERSDAAAKKAG